MDLSLRVETPPSLREQIVARIREWIAAGRFAPGARLIERELCEQMGVSRTSLREAFRQLEIEGLITVVPNRGPIVSIITADTAQEIYQIRAVLEGLAARLFVRNATPEDHAEIQAALAQIEGLSAHDAPSEYLAAKERFYLALLAGARNGTAAHMLGILWRRISQLRSIALVRADRVEASQRELRDLVTALAARDQEQAWSACVHHVEQAAEALLSVLRHQDGADNDSAKS